MVEHDVSHDGETIERQDGSTSRRQLLGWTLGSAAAVGAVVAGAAASDRATASAPTKTEAGQIMTGTWYVYFNVVPPTPTPLLIHITFTTDGGVIAANTPGAVLPGPRPALQQVGLGEWVRSGDREFTFRYNFHIFEQTTNGFSRAELASVWVMIKLNETLDRWTGTWKRRNVDPQGVFIRGAEGVTEAQRISVFPIE